MPKRDEWLKDEQSVKWCRISVCVCVCDIDGIIIPVDYTIFMCFAMLSILNWMRCCHVIFFNKFACRMLLYVRCLQYGRTAFAFSFRLANTLFVFRFLGHCRRIRAKNGGRKICFALIRIRWSMFNICFCC